MEEWRGFLGRYGVTGKMQTTRIGELSEGQKSRIVFAMLCMARPNMVRGSAASHEQHDSLLPVTASDHGSYT